MSIRKLSSSACLFAIASLWAAPAAAKEIKGRVASDLVLSGRAIDDIALPGARVRVFRNSTLVDEITANLQGEFSATLLPEGGIYSVIVEAADHLSHPRVIEAELLADPVIVLKPKTSYYCSNPIPHVPTIRNVHTFGAKGDGVSDDYDALRRAAKWISEPQIGRNPGDPPRKLVFPKGVYKINRWVDRGPHYFIDRNGARQRAGSSFYAPGLPRPTPTGRPDLQHFEDFAVLFEGKTAAGAERGCSNFEIIGCEATLDVKGDYPVGYFGGDIALGGKPCRFLGDRHQVVPFAFLGCQDFKLSGFEVRGNVSRMSGLSLQDFVDMRNPDGTKMHPTCDPALIQAVNGTRPEQLNEISGLIEGSSYGIATIASKRYDFKNLYVHGFATDGIALGIHAGRGDPGGKRLPVTISATTGALSLLDPRAQPSPEPSIWLDVERADVDVKVSNIKVHSNGRGGIGVIQVANARFVNVELVNNGRNLGSYLGHGPMFGVDVEPDRHALGEAFDHFPPINPRGQTFHKVVDLLTGDASSPTMPGIVFESSRIHGNRGMQFSSVYPEKVGQVRISRSFLATAPDSHPFAVALATRDGVLEDSQIRLGTQFIKAGLDPKGASKTRILRNQIWAEGRGISSVDVSAEFPGSNVCIQGNRFDFRAPSPGAQADPPTLKAIEIINPRARFKGNEIMFHSAVPSNQGTWKEPNILMQIRGAAESSGNTYRSFRKPNASKIVLGYGGERIIRTPSATVGGAAVISRIPLATTPAWREGLGSVVSPVPCTDCTPVPIYTNPEAHAAPALPSPSCY